MIKNSVEAMPGGGEIIIQTAAEPNYVVITFKDTGQGIPEDTRGRIFDPFFTTKGPGSSGLGMSVSYGIINRHQGSIAFESQEGSGTTFLIRLPVATYVPEQQPARMQPVSVRTATILVIDDEQDVRDTLTDILHEGGHRAVAAVSGAQGLKLFADGSFDLVFTDLGMPGMSGYQVAEEIKKLNSLVPVFLITGWQVHLSEEQLGTSGIDLVLNKPFQLHQVLDLVQQGLELRARRLAAA
jgi:CheY-like chemotaxis protein